MSSLVVGAATAAADALAALALGRSTSHRVRMCSPRSPVTASARGAERPFASCAPTQHSSPSCVQLKCSCECLRTPPPRESPSAHTQATSLPPRHSLGMRSFSMHSLLLPLVCALVCYWMVATSAMASLEDWARPLAQAITPSWLWAAQHLSSSSRIDDSLDLPASSIDQQAT